jgi:hypothetical protein
MSPHGWRSVAMWLWELEEYKVVEKEYEGVQRSSGVQFGWKLELFQWRVQSEEDDSVSAICELF